MTFSSDRSQIKFKRLKVWIRDPLTLKNVGRRKRKEIYRLHDNSRKRDILGPLVVNGHIQSYENYILPLSSIQISNTNVLMFHENIAL